MIIVTTLCISAISPGTIIPLLIFLCWGLTSFVVFTHAPSHGCFMCIPYLVPGTTVMAGHACVPVVNIESTRPAVILIVEVIVIVCVASLDQHHMVYELLYVSLARLIIVVSSDTSVRIGSALLMVGILLMGGILDLRAHSLHGGNIILCHVMHRLW